ncbi:sterol desaturase family protein [Mycolicibacterium sp. XJ1819]
MTTRTPARRGFTLADAGRQFWTHPSPWLISAVLVAAAAARAVVGDWKPTDAIVAVVMLAIFPFFEWVIHVFLLHWRPRRVGRLTIDPLLASEHRAHHRDPRSIGLIFIPWKSLVSWVLPLTVGVGLLAFPRLGMGLTYLVTIATFALVYEWTHYLIHTDYKPKSRVYRAIWRNHRNHHYKNEHYWFTVTSANTADRVLGTNPDPATVENSPTAKNLHAEAL